MFVCVIVDGRTGVVVGAFSTTEVAELVQITVDHRQVLDHAVGNQNRFLRSKDSC